MKTANQKLFEYMSNEHNVTLLESDIAEIQSILEPKLKDALTTIQLMSERLEEKDEALKVAQELNREFVEALEGCQKIFETLKYPQTVKNIGKILNKAK